MIRVESLSHFVEQVVKVGKTRHIRTKDFNLLYRHFYRGHSDTEYELIPSIARKNSLGKNNINYESQMIKRAKLRNPNELSNINNQLNLIAKLQHYGLQTRLLDITENALIALYFACSGSVDKDGEVIIFEESSAKIQDCDMLLPRFYSQISKYYALEYKIDVFINMFIKDKENLDLMTLNYTSAEHNTKKTIKSTVMKNIENPVILNHAIHSEREVRQQATFILFPNRFDEEREVFVNDILPIKKDNKLIIESLIVPKELKNDLISELKLFGITDEFIFPEFSNRCKSINQEIGNLYADNTEYSNEILNKIINRRFDFS